LERRRRRHFAGGYHAIEVARELVGEVERHVDVVDGGLVGHGSEIEIVHLDVHAPFSVAVVAQNARDLSFGDLLGIGAERLEGVL
jgi:glyoxylase-like metal-dependent hydrolase (beta-lactamase superfamily II)